MNIEELLKHFRNWLFSVSSEKDGPAVSSINERQRIVEGVRRFFKENYELRYNVMKQTEEFRRKEPSIVRQEPLISREEPLISQEVPLIQAGEAAWQQLTDREFRKMAIEQMEKVGVAWSIDVELYVRSATHKSTFCRLLLPPQLREYYIDDIKLDNAEQVERMLSRMLLVNIDEYNAKTDREQAKIKRVLTEKNVQTRKMRSDQYVLLPRMASFIATTNDLEPLYDPTGSRRYLCCEVTGIIDTDTPINHRAIYAQAMKELRDGGCWYFSKDEEADIERHNQNYRRQTTPETVLLSYFEPAERSKDHFMLAVDIQKELRKHVRMTDVPSIKKLTLALKACHFPYGKIQGVRGWYARAIKK